MCDDAIELRVAVVTEQPEAELVGQADATDVKPALGDHGQDPDLNKCTKMYAIVSHG